MRDFGSDRTRPRWLRVVGVLVVLAAIVGAGQVAKHRGHPAQVTTAVSAAPIVALSSPPAVTTPARVTPSPTLTEADQPDPATVRLTAGCAPTPVRHLLTTLMTAFNRGDASTVQQLTRYAGEISWFPTRAVLPANQSVAGLHAHHASLRLTSYRSGDLQVVQRSFTATLDASATGVPGFRAVGSGAVTCATGVPQLVFLNIDTATT